MLDPPKFTLEEGFAVIRARIRNHPFFYLSYFSQSDSAAKAKNAELVKALNELHQLEHVLKELLNEKTN